MSQVLSPVGGAYGYALGSQVNLPDIVHPFKIAVGANSTIAEHDAVAFITISTDVELTIEQLDVSDAAPALIAGVALEAGVAGEVILIARQGPAIVNISTGSVAVGESAGVGGADGTLDTGLATAMACGVFLGTEIGTTNTAWVDLRPSAYGPAAS